MRTDIQANITEEYYQISEAILSSFPKYRPPLDLYYFNDKVSQLQIFAQRENRLTNEQVERLFTLCAAGDIFVARSDFPVYSKHIAQQLDLVLVDGNLRPAEIADITVSVVKGKLLDFFAQPVKPVYMELLEAAAVVTEYLWQDRNRISLYLERLSTGEHSLDSQALNCFTIGLWLLCSTRGARLTRREFDRTALGLLIHDAGMTRIPPFIIGKKSALKAEEWEKIPPHPLTAMKIAQKLEITSDELRGVVLEHHERLDGSGYPLKLRAGEISPYGCLAAVADSFSAMIQSRPGGRRFDPVDAARALAADRKRYDPGFTNPLVAAYAMNKFSLL